MADWIQVKLKEKEMAAYHLASKMGIAAATVNEWKGGVTRPKARHILEMVKILGKYCASANPESPNP